MVLLPLSCHYLTCWVYHFALPVHLTLHEVSHISLLLIWPQKCSLSIYFIVWEATFKSTHRCFEDTLTFFLIFWKLTSINNIFILIVDDTISMHMSLIKISMVGTMIFPLINTFSMPFAVLKLAIVWWSIPIDFLTISMGFSIDPVSHVGHGFIFILKGTIAIELGILETSLIVWTIEIDEGSIVSLSFSVIEVSNINLSLFEVADSVPVGNILLEWTLIGYSKFFNVIDIIFSGWLRIYFSKNVLNFLYAA